MNTGPRDAAPSIMYKAVGLDYTSYWDVQGRLRATSPPLRWDVGSVVPSPGSEGTVRRDGPQTCLWLYNDPTQTLRELEQSWPPFRLLEVEPLGDVIDSDRDYSWTCFPKARVIREIEAWRALGPQGEQVAALIDRAERVTAEEARRLRAAPDIADWGDRWDAAWRNYEMSGPDPVLPRQFSTSSPRNSTAFAAQGAAHRAAQRATERTGTAAGTAAGYAAWALVQRDLIGTDDSWTQRAYDELVRPWSSVIGKAHPHDQGP
jgi:hypothetical protein